MPSVHTLIGIVNKVARHANTILATLQEEYKRRDIMSIVQQISDVPLRTQDIGRTINVIDTQRQSWNKMKFTRRDSIIRSGYSRVKDAGKKRYSTVIQSRVTNDVTGESFDSFITITHDEQLTRGALEKSTRDFITDNGQRTYMTIGAQKPVQGFTWRPRRRR